MGSNPTPATYFSFDISLKICYIIETVRETNNLYGECVIAVPQYVTIEISGLLDAHSPGDFIVMARQMYGEIMYVMRKEQNRKFKEAIVEHLDGIISVLPLKIRKN